jgi:hypothetical protein
MKLTSFTITDPLNDTSEGAVEVTLEFDNGEKRWCFFMTPESLSNTGDFIENTNVRIHYDAPHMIVVTKLDKKIIEKVLKKLEAEKLLIRCSKK